MKKTVFVTAIGSFSAAAVIGRYKEEGYRVLGCDIYPAEWIVASGEVDCFYRAPMATDKPAYHEFLRKVCEENQVDFVVPLTDVEVDALQEWRQEAEKLGVTLCISGRDTIGLCRDKGSLEHFLAPLKVCRMIPGESLLTVMEREADSSYELLQYPLIIKPRAGRSSQGLMRIKDSYQMRFAAEWCRDRAADFLVQPEISGIVITVDVVRDPRTETVVSLPRREYLRTPNGAGTSVYVFEDKRLQDQCSDIARALQICGCVNFEFVEKAEGQWYFLECNPRFSGGVAFSCMAGYDMPGNHLRCFTGQEIEPLGKISGQYLVKRYQEHRMETRGTRT